MVTSKPPVYQKHSKIIFIQTDLTDFETQSPLLPQNQMRLTAKILQPICKQAFFLFRQVKGDGVLNYINFTLVKNLTFLDYSYFWIFFLVLWNEKFGMFVRWILIIMFEANSFLTNLSKSSKRPRDLIKHKSTPFRNLFLLLMWRKNSLNFKKFI